MRKKIMFVFGTRPEAIKLAPVIKLFQNQTDLIISVCVTGQHRELLKDTLASFGICPEFDLNVMTHNQSLSAITAKVMCGLDELFGTEKPDLVIVHGDTATTFAASVTAYYNQIPISHVEAGLRTHDKYSPFPEEMNRQMVARMADLHFCPTQISRQNLIKEGIRAETIHITGNTVIDALLYKINELTNDESKAHALKLKFDFLDNTKRLILVTGHRRENFGKGLYEIIGVLKDIAYFDTNVQIVYPVHPNPNVKSVVYSELSQISNVFLIEPLDYDAFIFLMSQSHLIVTDSGGIQEEAPSLGIPILVTRTNSERPEGVAAGCAKLVGTNKEVIFDMIKKLLTDRNEYEIMAASENPYGSGHASEMILSIVKSFLELK